ncbi:MAG: UDP-glucose 4-epimerase GalE [SAR86 cluster bacterium]|jgi:UDP-glucose 4-epimerase|uniref:UDP-glucose 4-epimerase n=1 Tax=SAR86 cluster bacterium TaxID=2030880 RepID=A0A972VVH0_9GAMM|nr:UDP-glucose 4-epimerase GalE [SAR86 cluster bacterium]
MKILLTGGAGYIGSHTAVELILAGHQVTIVDNLANSSAMSVARVEALTQSNVALHKIDLLEVKALDQLFANQPFDAVVHFAGLKAVGESVREPLNYYQTNINTTLNLVDCMLRHDVHRLVFSSSATVYGEPEKIPVDESSPIIDATNPYSRSKLFIEKILEDVCIANPKFNVARLRYFNPGGAHASGEIGEDPHGTPNNLLPFVTQVAVGKLQQLVVFGQDYATPDGTCVRDYIHVVDLARGHLAAINKLAENPGLVTYNLGSGVGHSVLDVIHAFETANHLTLPYTVGPRREGDIAEYYADPTKALQELGWRAEKSLEDICRDAWRWQQKNPDGYPD